VGGRKVPPFFIRDKLYCPHRPLYSGLTTLYKKTDPTSHILQWWKAELLQFRMEIEHCMVHMMWECGMISRYNQTKDYWRENGATAAAAEKRKENIVEKVAAFKGGSPQ
jgi:hypothetical protein